MTAHQSGQIILHADKEHAGVRYVVLAILGLASIIAFLLFNGFLRSLSDTLISEYAFVLSCVGGLVIGLICAGAVEFVLKRSWPSGRMVLLDEDGVKANLPEGQTVSLDWSLNSYATKWYFSLKGFPRGGREKRVPTSYFCLACQIQQDEDRLVVYSYLPKNRAENWIEDSDFFEINPGDFYENNPLRKWFRAPDRPEIPTSTLTGKQGPYWMGERRRWNQGLELTPDDFELFLENTRPHLEQ